MEYMIQELYIEIMFPYSLLRTGKFKGSWFASLRFRGFRGVL